MDFICIELTVGELIMAFFDQHDGSFDILNQLIL
jgi:hypothetical protein